MNEFNFFRDLIRLDEGRAENQEIIDSILKSSNFSGTNFWALVSAIIVASVGLNTGSTAVIIGAMLISPLMGPIMGLGLGLSLFDTNMLRRSLRNFGLMVGISIAASTFYFFISPLKIENNELLARTYPTIWDVLIAIFGGIAGMIGSSRKEKTNIIPGVAIATALMPPLCTVGFGLANQNWPFFFGALYLFSINTLFIAWATYIISNLMKINQYSPLPGKQPKMIRRLLSFIVLAMIIPSIYLAYLFMQETLFKQRAARFIEEEMKSSTTFVLNREVNAKNRELTLYLMGEPLDSLKKAELRARFERINQNNATLRIIQEDSKAEIMAGLKDEKKGPFAEIVLQKHVIDSLRTIVESYRNLPHEEEEIKRELQVFVPDVKRLLIHNTSPDTPDEVLIGSADILSREQQEQCSQWLRKRMKSDSLSITFVDL